MTRRISVAAAAALAVMLSACSNGALPTSSAAAFRADNAASSSVLYLADYFGKAVKEYKVPDRQDKGPACKVGSFGHVNGIAVDANGVLYVPDVKTHKIKTFAPHCGKAGAVLDDTNGPPTDVAIDGTTAYVTDLKTGAIDVFANGSTKPTDTLKSKYIKENAFGVAFNGHHDVFEASENGVIVKFAGGKAPGVKLKLRGLSMPFGLEISNTGSLIVCDEGAGVLVYAPPYQGGPARRIGLQNTSLYVKLDAANKTMYVSDLPGEAIDVYDYSSGVFEYDITTGVSGTNDVEGIAVDPRSKS
jgi:hypothetical protein